MKLEYFSLYLPFDVEVKQLNVEGRDTFTLDVEGLRCMEVQGLENFRLILRPLSDLDKEIEHQGMTFTPKLLIDSAFPAERMGLNTATWSFRVVRKLMEWHFDVFNLIGAGAAITRE